MLTPFFIPLAERMPKVRVSKRLQEKLYYLGIGLDARKWGGLSIVSLFVVSALLAPYGILTAILAGALVGGFIYMLPLIEARQKEAAIEAELPLFLRNLGVFLNIGLDYISSLKILSKEGELGKELRRIIEDIERGGGIVKALSEYAERVDSIVIKRALAQMISSFEHGGKGYELKRLGSELLNVQRHKLKDYIAKSSMISLLFIMISIVAPTFYIVITLLKPLVFSSQINEAEFALYIVVLFPLSSLILLLVAKMLSPQTAFKSSKEPFYVIGIAALLALATLSTPEATIKMAIFLLFLAVSIYAFLKEWREARYREEVEKNLANALLTISGFPKGIDAERLFKRISRAKLGAISKEFDVAYRQIKSGLSIDKVIADLKARIKSPSFSRAMDVLLYSLKIGGDISRRMAEMAEDILSFMELKREKASLLATQKYTLLLGVLLAGLVVGNVVSLSERFGELSKGSIKAIAIKYVPSYLILISGLVAWFSSYLEGSNTKSLIYLSALSLLSLLIFFHEVGIV